MNESHHFFRNTILVIGGVIVAGWLALWLIGFVVHIFLYLVLGAVVVGGGYYLYGRAKKSPIAVAARPREKPSTCAAIASKIRDLAALGT
jgi:cbb3-type cytochrome oxidase subunit 3